MGAGRLAGAVCSVVRGLGGAGVGVVVSVAVAGSAGASSSGGARGGVQEVPVRPVEGREVAALRTEHSRTWVKPGGLRVTRVFQEPVSVRDEAGGWRLIDSRLRRAGAAWVTRGDRYGLRVPGRSGDGPVRVEDGGRWVSLQLRGADVAASVSGRRRALRGWHRA